MVLVSLVASRLSSLAPPIHASPSDSGDETSSVISSQGTCSSLSGSSIDSHMSGSPISNSLRKNEHLAVLLPKHLWKLPHSVVTPDSQASRCDIFLCRKKFSIWERKHHCRKCGGVFCADCSMRPTTLLDTSSLEFFHPPRDVPISKFDSPTSPVVVSRVCDDCYDLIHGRKGSRSPVIDTSAHLPLQRQTPLSAASSISGSTGSRRNDSSPVRPRMRRAHTSPRVPSSPLRGSSSPPPNTITGTHVSDGGFGELETYPLRYASAICKANGGGRWEPKPVNLVGYQIPGRKAPYEIELEREEEEIRRRRANPLIIDGDFQLRAAREPEPRSPGGPIQFSTF